MKDIQAMETKGTRAEVALAPEIPTAQYFTFFLKETLYGIEIENVREIIEYEKVNAVPRVPAYIKGVINVRGEIIPVIDLPQRLFQRGTEINRFTAIAVIETADGSDSALMGIIVDRVNRVMEINPDTITAPEVGYKVRPDLLRGIGSDGTAFILLLNERQMLNINEMAEEIGETSGFPASGSGMLQPIQAE